MDDSQIHGTIDRLVAEEHELWEREAGGDASESDRERLRELKVSLDQCWDLLRQRVGYVNPSVMLLGRIR
jgi:hypothetical protein